MLVTLSESGDGKSEKESIVLDHNMNEMDIDSLQYQTAVKGWLNFCRKHSSVRCVEYEVPKGILPKGYNGVLIDVKVGGPKRAPDDKLYLAHADLRAKVARGNCVLELNKIENGKLASTKYIFLVFALKKFSGGLGDEDDSNYSQSQWFHYFIKDIDTTKRVVATEKANGEAAHISYTKFLGQKYFCIGSKNVHMLVRNSDDISQYKESRFEFARRIALTIFRSYLENPEVDENKVQSFLTYMQNNHLTLVAEIVQPDHQHVVNLSYLKQPEVRFICWTKADFLQDSKDVSSLCPLPIDSAINKAREFGLQTVEYEEIHIVENATLEMEQYMLKIRKEHGHEGKVLNFIDQDNCTIGLIKKKTAWYIILRALREKVAAFKSGQPSSFLDDKIKSIRKRIGAIKIWLGLSSETAEGWTDVSIQFARWLHKNPKNCVIRSNFPVIFDQYLSENPQQKKKYEELLKNIQITPT